ncbi:MAG: hypothetical protein WBE37_18375 [Bryobacteraceae bacterium]
MALATQLESAPVTAPRFAGPKRYLDPREASDYTGIGLSTLSIHRMKGTGPKYIKWGMNIRYDIFSLDAFMAEREVTPAAPVTAKRRVGRPRREGK